MTTKTKRTATKANVKTAAKATPARGCPLILKTPEELIAYLNKTGYLIRVPERGCDPDEEFYPVDPVLGSTLSDAAMVKAKVINKVSVKHFSAGELAMRDLTETGIFEGEWMFDRHHPQYGFGKASINYGLPKGMPVTKLKPGFKIKTRWNEGDCYAVILDRDTVKKGRTFELHVLLDSGNVTYASSDQVLEIIGSVF